MSEEKVTLEILSISYDGKDHKTSEFIKSLKDRYSKNTILKHQKSLVEDRLLKKKHGSAQESFKPKYQITRKGMKYLSSKSESNLKAICETLQAIINQTFTPDNLYQLREDGSLIPQEAEDRKYLNKEEIVKWIKHHNEVFGPLHSLFFLIAKKLMDAEEKIKEIEEAITDEKLKTLPIQ